MTKNDSNDSRTVIVRAREWLLANVAKPKLARDIYKAGEEEGLSDTTLKRARHGLEGEGKFKKPFKTASGWWWSPSVIEEELGLRRPEGGLDAPYG